MSESGKPRSPDGDSTPEASGPRSAADIPSHPVRDWIMGGRKKLLMRQRNMKRMLFALTPILLSAIYFFGWRVLAVFLLVNVVGFATELITSRQRKQPVSMACFVTCWLFGLSLPVTVPYGVAAVGVVVAVLFGKEVFGGFGRNFANPAIVGRAFVYVCFPVPLTAKFVPAFQGFPGGFGHWSMRRFVETTGRLPEYIDATLAKTSDVVTQASPLYINKYLGPEVMDRAVSLWEMFLGNINGAFVAEGETRILAAGSMGEGSSLLILLAAVYLLATKTANWRLMLGGLIGMATSTVLFRHVLGFNAWSPGSPDVSPLHYNLFGGTTLYVLVFMLTDPVSAPKQKAAIWGYAFFFGFALVFLRWRGVFVASASFSLLLANIVSPLLDIGAESWKERKKRKAVEADAPAEGGAA